MSSQQLVEALICLAAALATAIEISPLKINPWSAIAKAVGRAVNAEVLAELEQLRKDLNDHISVADERNAESLRSHILHFNNELIAEMPHTKESFVEVLGYIDDYEAYCLEHPNYKNNRATHAIANIGRAYDERLQKHDFI